VEDFLFRFMGFDLKFELAFEMSKNGFEAATNTKKV